MRKNNLRDNKQFDEWIEIKKALHTSNKIPRIAEGEVWWCGMGKNVGVEINGKNEQFSRPVLVFKKLSKLGFLAIPLSTQTHHNGNWYIHFNFQKRENVAVLSQIKIISVSRLYTRLGEIDETDFQKIKAGFWSLYR